MRSHRFYCESQLDICDSFELPKAASHHCVQVLRYRPGQTLTLFNGDGYDYLAQIIAIENKRCLVRISEKLDPENESPLNIHLFQGIARGDKMDLIIQKAVELGVAEITPLFSQYCNVKLDTKRLEKKQLHWQNVAISACEQSGRALVPKVNAAVNIDKLECDSGAQHYYLDPAAEPQSQISTEQGLSLYIGPEGGFSEKDLAILQQSNAKGMRLGPRVLRTETAGLAALATLQALYGDF